MINRDGWLRAVQAAADAPLPESSAVSMEEFARVIGLCRTAAARRMVALVAAGRAVKTTKRMRKADGHLQVVTAYELMPEGPVKKDNLDVELEPGLDGADTSDSDDPGEKSPDEYVRATKGATLRSPRHRSPRKESHGRKSAR